MLTRRTSIITTLSIFTFCFLFLKYTTPSISQIVPAGSPTPQVLSAQTSSPCTARGVLPDPSCTPGAINPAVTQDNLGDTICKKGYTSTIRPPVSYTNNLKREQLVLYGYADLDPKLYEEDHLIPLELGGAPSDPKNLWPELGDTPNPKDIVENRCNRMVCRGEISLTRARAQVAQDWTTACQP